MVDCGVVIGKGSGLVWMNSAAGRSVYIFVTEREMYVGKGLTYGLA